MSFRDEIIVLTVRNVFVVLMRCSKIWDHKLDHPSQRTILSTVKILNIGTCMSEQTV